MRSLINGTGWRLLASISMLLLIVLVASAAPQTKVLLCTGDFGMWAQDRATRIMQGVEKVAPGKATFEVEQSYNFVKKLEAPGFAERFDVIACGDIALGQMTGKAQDAIVRFVNNGGGFIYIVDGKSGIASGGPAAAEPTSLAAILPYNFPANNPEKDARADATVVKFDDQFLNGLDFSKVTILSKEQLATPLFLERKQGKGAVIALYGAFSAPYEYVGYADFRHKAGGWDEWTGLGDLWSRLLTRASATSPIAKLSRAEVDAAIKEKPLAVTVSVNAKKEIDDIRASNFSIVNLGQLYREDGGGNENMFLELNPRDWLDRSSDQVLDNKAGKAFPDKTQLFKTYNIKGILHGNNSYGSYGNWKEEDWTNEITRLGDTYKKYPEFLSYFQPGNEPPCDDNYFKFYNRLSTEVMKQAPALKVIGPGCAFNIGGPNEKAMKAFIDSCGANTDVLNWHIYACPPENVKNEVLYWSNYAKGKLRGNGPVKVMFTESDTWNTRDSQFNYIMDRAFTFLPMKEIVATFQYCMDPRFEGGSYWFGVLQSEKDGKGNPNEFRANYNGYWIFRNLRGKMVETTVAGVAADVASHVKVISSNTDGGKTVTAVVYYDTGYFDAAAKAKASQAKVTVNVALPNGTYQLERSEANWSTNTVTKVDGTAKGNAKVELTLNPCQAVALTWIRQD